MKRALILFAGIGGFCQNIDFAVAAYIFGAIYPQNWGLTND
jgi:hypothetical protein